MADAAVEQIRRASDIDPDDQGLTDPDPLPAMIAIDEQLKGFGQCLPP
ncbi:MAG TPA: hypothetical protein VMF86_15325 [Stellaceae bacterium]|nr:hypothetical protein [Stellaceae bacterium]